MDPWGILDTYFHDHRYPFTKHHLDSFREFLKTHIPNSIRSYNPLVMMKEDEAGNEILRVQIYVGGKEGKQIYLERPTILDEEGKSMLLTPQEARLRNLTYNTHIFADILIEYYKDGASEPVNKTFHMTYIGSIPLMLHSDHCVLHGQGSKVLQALGECPMDPGGYFIIDGKEKVIVSQERITTNRLFIEKYEPSEDPNFAFRAMIRCTGSSGETALSPRTVEFMLIRQPDTLFEANVKEDFRPFTGAILVSLPSIKGHIPLSVLFRALGVENDKQITELICGPIEETHEAFLHFLRPSFAHGASSKIYTMSQALEYLRVRSSYESIAHVRSILAVDIFPNIPDSLQQKAVFLGYLVNRFMKTALGILQTSDRDSYIFKRVDISGFLLAQLFQESYDIFRKFVRDQVDREYYYGPWKNTGTVEDLIRIENLAKIFPGTMLTETFARSLKGRWGSNPNDPDQSKVQDLARLSYIGFLSHLRRVNLPLDRSIKITGPHRLHSQQWGIMCPFESPDGASIGYLKNFALLTQITFGTSEENMIKCLQDLGVMPVTQIPPNHHMSPEIVRVFLNGLYYGVTKSPFTVVRAMRIFRRTGIINPFVSVAWNIVENEIRIQTEAGRPCRPLFIVEDGKLTYKKKGSWFEMVFGTLLPESELNNDAYYMDKYRSPFDMMDFQGRSLADILRELERKQGCIEYLDIEEENTMYIAMKEDAITGYHTHLEIHPSTAFSVVTNIVPFANHNQAPRVIFHGSQSKQAIGIYATNFSKRFDTMGYIQHYPQKRIVTTRGAFYNGAVRMPNGCNVIVAIATYNGWNQEDSIIINKSSIDRGLFHITAYKTMTASEKTLTPSERVIFANPVRMRDQGKEIHGVKHANYTLLGDDGIIKEEAYIPRGQEAVVLGMVHVRDKVKDVVRGIFTEKEIEEQYHDVSLRTDVHHYGKVDRVFVATQNQGTTSRIAKVRFRKVRRPELGDKSCSSHGQKGVFGMILPQHEMPYTKDGVVPDLIINPHAFPSRMTIGHLIETVTSKLCCLEGCYADGTVFMPFDQNEVYNKLEKTGYERHGNEILYNGKTGQQIATEIFIGPVYYYRLKHMVTDKIHARGFGPKDGLTKQPTSGRSKGGGLRIGEMERDVLLGHGLAQFTKENMMEKSDKYRWTICKCCGVLAMHKHTCKACGGTDIATVTTPYAFKLLVQELEAMGVQARLSHMAPPEDDFEEPLEEEMNDEEMHGGQDPIETEDHEETEPLKEGVSNEDEEEDPSNEDRDTEEDHSKEDGDTEEEDHSKEDGEEDPLNGNDEDDSSNEEVLSDEQEITEEVPFPPEGTENNTMSGGNNDIKVIMIDDTLQGGRGIVEDQSLQSIQALYHKADETRKITEENLVAQIDEQNNRSESENAQILGSTQNNAAITMRKSDDVTDNIFNPDDGSSQMLTLDGGVTVSEITRLRNHRNALMRNYENE